MAQQRIEALAKHLEALSYRSVLQRGFSVTRLAASGRIVRSAFAVATGDLLLTEVADGRFASVAQSGADAGEQQMLSRKRESAPMDASEEVKAPSDAERDTTTYAQTDDQRDTAQTRGHAGEDRDKTRDGKKIPRKQKQPDQADDPLLFD